MYFDKICDKNEVKIIKKDLWGLWGFVGFVGLRGVCGVCGVLSGLWGFVGFVGLLGYCGFYKVFFKKAEKNKKNHKYII